MLRACGPEEAERLRVAIDSSLDHLRAWLPWVAKEPRSLEETREKLRKGKERFDSAEDFMYAIFNSEESEILGGAGLHRRSDEDSLEIGYWIRADSVGKGYATEAARALGRVGLAAPGIRRVQIDCDPANVRSARVPEKLGFRLVDRRIGNKRTPSGAPRDTLVFEATVEWLHRQRRATPGKDRS